MTTLAQLIRSGMSLREATAYLKQEVPVPIVQDGETEIENDIEFEPDLELDDQDEGEDAAD